MNEGIALEYFLTGNARQELSVRVRIASQSANVGVLLVLEVYPFQYGYRISLDVLYGVALPTKLLIPVSPAPGSHLDCTASVAQRLTIVWSLLRLSGPDPKSARVPNEFGLSARLGMYRIHVG